MKAWKEGARHNTGYKSRKRKNGLAKVRTNYNEREATGLRLKTLPTRLETQNFTNETQCKTWIAERSPQPSDDTSNFPPPPRALITDTPHLPPLQSTGITEGKIEKNIKKMLGLK